MNTVNNTSKKTAQPIRKDAPKPQPARRVTPYVPGLKIKYLVPDPFGTGR